MVDACGAAAVENEEKHHVWGGRDFTKSNTKETRWRKRAGNPPFGAFMKEKK